MQSSDNILELKDAYLDIPDFFEEDDRELSKLTRILTVKLAKTAPDILNDLISNQFANLSTRSFSFGRVYETLMALIFLSSYDTIPVLPVLLKFLEQHQGHSTLLIRYLEGYAYSILPMMMKMRAVEYGYSGTDMRQRYMHHVLHTIFIENAFKEAHQHRVLEPYSLEETDENKKCWQHRGLSQQKQRLLLLLEESGRDEAELLQMRVCLRDLRPSRLRFAAFLGHEPAQIALKNWGQGAIGKAELKDLKMVKEWLYSGHGKCDLQVFARIGQALGRYLLPLWEARCGYDTIVGDALIALENWLLLPGEARLKRARVVGEDRWNGSFYPDREFGWASCSAAWVIIEASSIMMEDSKWQFISSAYEMIEAAVQALIGAANEEAFCLLSEEQAIAMIFQLLRKRLLPWALDGLDSVKDGLTLLSLIYPGGFCIDVE